MEELVQIAQSKARLSLSKHQELVQAVAAMAAENLCQISQLQNVIQSIMSILSPADHEDDGESTIKDMSLCEVPTNDMSLCE